MFQQNLKCYLGFAVCAGEEKKRGREREKIGVTGRNTENMFSVKERKKKTQRGRWVCCYLQDLKSKVIISHTRKSPLF